LDDDFLEIGDIDENQSQSFLRVRYFRVMDDEKIDELRPHRFEQSRSVVRQADLVDGFQVLFQK
jgi:hypothetical protein